MQSRGNGVRKGAKKNLPESAATIKGGDLGFGSLLYLAKSAPSPRFKLNPYLNYNKWTGKIEFPDDINASIEILNDMLMGRINNEMLLKDIVDKENDISENIDL